MRFQPTGYGETRLEYRVFASGGLALPAPEGPTRRDGLWETTCFEMFVRVAAETAYSEFNFSPSRAWAAYGFTSHRRGRGDLELVPPKIDFWSDVTGCSLRVQLDLVAPWAFDSRIGLSAIIQEADGTKSYWALAHPNAEKPDFHDPACFAAHLP